MSWKVPLPAALRSLFRRSSEAIPKPVAFIDHDGSVVAPQAPNSTLLNERWTSYKAQIRSLLAEAMVRAGAMTNQYKVWINPIDGQINTVSVMIRLDPSLALSEEPQIQVEEFLIEYAKEKYDIDIYEINWLDDVRSTRQRKSSPSIDFRLDTPAHSRL